MKHKNILMQLDRKLESSVVAKKLDEPLIPKFMDNCLYKEIQLQLISQLFNRVENRLVAPLHRNLITHVPYRGLTVRL